MSRKLLSVLLLVLWGLGLAQCGDSNSNSKKVKFKVVPMDPVVVLNGDMTLNAGSANEIKIKAPWFIFNSSIENGSDKTVYVVTLQLVGNGTKNGAPTKVKTTLNPNSSCTTTGSNRGYLAIIAAGDTYKRNTSADGCDPTSYDDTSFEDFYIHSLPASDNPTYSLEVTAAGWFVDSDDVPIERLTIFGSLTTK